MIGHDIDPKACRAAARAGVEIAQGIAPPWLERTRSIITSLPHPSALHDTVAAIVAAKVKLRIVAEASTFTLEDKLNAEQTLRKAGHTMLDCPISGTGSQARVKDVVVNQRRCARDPQAQAGVAAFGRGCTSRRVRKLQSDRRSSPTAGRDPQRRDCRGHGARHEAGLDPKAIFETIKTGAGNRGVPPVRATMVTENTATPP